MSFNDLGLNKKILDNLDELGYSDPSPIQAKAIPHVVAGKDVLAAAQTGTGKTAGFTLPILHRLAAAQKPQSTGNSIRALVLTPTRELAAQVAASVQSYSKGTKCKSVVVFGGVSINPQLKQLRGGADILIATPGRLLDIYGRKGCVMDKLEILVLDEADRMLDMGFIHDIKRIVKVLPKKRQTLLFSATFSNDIRSLAQSFLYKPVEVSVTPPNSTVNLVSQSLIAVEKSDKTRVLTRLVKERDWFQVLVFSRTKHGANKLAKKLNAQDIQSMAIHGNKSQGARTKALAEFKAGKLQVLVATDIAARGIDIQELPFVVNFDLPSVPEDYVHRIGRTGRAGATGKAISLASHDEIKQLNDIERLIKKAIPRETLDGYEPLNALAESKGDYRDRKPKKPKKKKTPQKLNSNKSDKKGHHSEQSDKSKRRRRPNAGKPKNSAKKKPNKNNLYGSKNANKK